MSAELFFLRVVHVLGGIFWVGSGLFSALFLVPALGAAGPAAGPVMGALQKRRLFTILPIVAVATMASGLRLMWITSGGFQEEYFQSRNGVTFALAGVASVIAFILSLLVARPAAVRASQLAASMGSTTEGAARAAAAAELAQLRRRGAIVNVVVVALLVSAAVGMSVARYL